MLSENDRFDVCSYRYYTVLFLQVKRNRIISDRNDGIGGNYVLSNVIKQDVQITFDMVLDFNHTVDKKH